MRAVALPSLVLPLFLLDCGSKADLIIGEIQTVSTAGKTSTLPTAGTGTGTGAEPGTAGTAQGATGGTEVAGSGGSSEGGALSGAGGAGMAGEGGAIDAPGGASGACEPPLGSLVHRYSFDGTGTSVIDSVGGANGNLVGGATLDGSGVLTLPGNRDGQPDQYLNLPNGIISKLDGVTIDCWSKEHWWVNVRKSNTEPLLRVNCEARDKKTLDKALAAITPGLGKKVDH